MNTEELAIELGHAEAQELLRFGPLVRLAYNGPDGLPRVPHRLSAGLDELEQELGRDWPGRWSGRGCIVDVGHLGERTTV
jgi:hypothetical protein